MKIAELINRVAWAGRRLAYPFTTAEFRQRVRRKMVERTYGQASAAPGKLDGVNIIGCPFARSGMAEGCRSSIRALSAVDPPCVVVDSGIAPAASGSTETLDVECRKQPEFPVSLIHINAAEMDLVRSRFPAVTRGDHIAIGYWYWELPEFPAEWMHAFQGLSEIWVASSFCQDAISRLSPVPVVRIPPCLPPRPSNLPDVQATRERYGIPTDKFVFLCMADALSALPRKNPKGALDAFTSAFERDDRRACLVVKVSNLSHTDGEFADELRSAAKSRPIVILDSDLARDELTALQSVVDCFVSLHRSEGYGLPIAEAMRLGKPCIATGWSGNMEFMTPWNSLPVDYELSRIERTVGEYTAGSTWANPSIPCAAKLMREMAEHPDRGIAIGARAAAEIATATDPARVGSQMLARLQHLTSEAGR